MNSLNAFILLELFTFRNLKKVDNSTLLDFRHIIMNYLSNSISYEDFLSKLSINSLLMDKNYCKLCLSFKRYLKKAYKIWEGNDVVFGYRDRYLHCKVPKI